jgi:hypothetical protein
MTLVPVIFSSKGIKLPFILSSPCLDSELQKLSSSGLQPKAVSSVMAFLPAISSPK